MKKVSRKESDRTDDTVLGRNADEALKEGTIGPKASERRLSDWMRTSRKKSSRKKFSSRDS